MIRTSCVFRFLSKPERPTFAPRGDSRLGKERFAQRMERVVQSERKRELVKKKRTFKERIQAVKDYPWVWMVGFLAVWSFVGFRFIFPWRGFVPGELPPNAEKFPPDQREKLKPVPHWVPLGKKPENKS